MIGFIRGLTSIQRIGFTVLVIIMAIILFFGWVMLHDHNLKKRVIDEKVAEINKGTEEFEKQETKLDESIKKDVANKPVADVANSLRNDCRDCDDKQGVRVQGPVNNPGVKEGRVDRGDSTSGRHSKPDTKAALPGCTLENLNNLPDLYVNCNYECINNQWEEVCD